MTKAEVLEQLAKHKYVETIYGTWFSPDRHYLAHIKRAGRNGYKFEIEVTHEGKVAIRNQLREAYKTL